MTASTVRVITLAVAGSAIVFGAPATAQGTEGAVIAPAAAPGGVAAPARFAAPRRIRAGQAFLGAGRLYPSPVLHDVDGDGRQDVVVGDLFGRITFARRETAGPVAVFAAEEQLKDRSGEQLKFQNW